MKKKKEMIKIKIDNSGRQTVLGRHLHKTLEIKTPYHIWLPRMLEYGFEQDKDYLLIEQKSSIKHELNTSKRTKINHQLTLDMAKEICMIQRTKIGKATRKYFLECEKRLLRIQKNRNDPEWVETRKEGIAVHREQTDAVKVYVDYAIENGSLNYLKKPRTAYSNFANLINKSLFIFTCDPKNVRNFLSKKQLGSCMMADKFLAKILLDEIEKGTPYKEIYQIVKSKFKVFSDLYGKTQVVELALVK